jgi:transcription termination factor NusB
MAMTDRQRALQLLQRIEREGLYASLVLIGETGFVRTVVLGVLRWRSRLDFVIEALASRPVKKLDDAVVDVLRLGLYQLLFMDVAAYAAVSEAVDLAPKRARGIVNAVLRRASEGKAPEPRDVATRTAHRRRRTAPSAPPRSPLRIRISRIPMFCRCAATSRRMRFAPTSFPISGSCTARALSCRAMRSIRWTRAAR